jgi:tRNA (guanine26-N2/guanine27-N2)-dimethyltransferase
MFAQRYLVRKKMENGDFEVVTEGKGSIIFPKTNQVFYNKVQEFNRDMSVCVIGRFIEILKDEMKAKDDKFRPRLYKHKYGTEDPHPAVIGSEYHTLPVSRFGLSQVHPAVLSVNTRHLETTHPAALNREAYNVASSSYSSSICSPSALSSRNNNDNKFSFEGVRILEALSATGLRSMRYAKELPHVRELIVNDYSAPAVDTIRKNIAFNKLDFNIVRPSLGDGNMVMYQSMSGARFDVIDLDPYGTASIFLDSAVQAIAEGMPYCRDFLSFTM